MSINQPIYPLSWVDWYVPDKRSPTLFQSEIKDMKRRKDGDRKMWIVFSRIIFKLPCSFLLDVVTSLLLVGLDGFGTSRAGLESILATPLSQIEREEREGENLEHRLSWSSWSFLLFSSKYFYFLEMLLMFVSLAKSFIVLHVVSSAWLQGWRGGTFLHFNVFTKPDLVVFHQ